MPPPAPDPTTTPTTGDDPDPTTAAPDDTTTTVTDGLHVVTRCTGMRATGDTRVVDADVNLVFTHCALD